MTTNRRKEYLVALAAAIDAARVLADTLDLTGDGWGDGFALETELADGTHLFSYGNTSDLLSDLAATVKEGAERA